MSVLTGRTGVLVVRVWVEEDGSPAIRARITSTDDVSTQGEDVTTAGSVAEILAAVEVWLTQFAAD